MCLENYLTCVIFCDFFDFQEAADYDIKISIICINRYDCAIFIMYLIQRLPKNATNADLYNPV